MELVLFLIGHESEGEATHHQLFVSDIFPFLLVNINFNFFSLICCIFTPFEDLLLWVEHFSSVYFKIYIFHNKSHCILKGLIVFIGYFCMLFLPSFGLYLYHVIHCNTKYLIISLEEFWCQNIYIKEFSENFNSIVNFLWKAAMTDNRGFLLWPFKL